MPPAPRSPQAEALDLPELDKADDADDVDVGSFELSLGDELEVDPVEPREAGVDTFEVDIQVLTDPGSNEAATDLDVGGDDLLDVLPDVTADRDSDAPPPTGADLDQHLDMPLESDDPSTEAELGDDGLEALPELMNEDGDGDAGPDGDRAFLPTAPEGEISPGPRYDSEWLLLGTPCTALCAGGDWVIATAEHVMRFGPERKSDALPPGARVSSVGLLAGGDVLMATTRGLLQLGSSGYSFVEAPEAARGSGAEVVELALAQGEHAIWARLANGALLRRRAGQWHRHAAGGEVRALTCNGQRVTLLVISQRATLQLSSDAGSSFRELILPEPAATVALGSSPTAVSLGPIVALADPERGLCVSNDSGESFRMVTGAVNVAAIAIGQHAGAASVFAALHRESRDLTELVVVTPATGHALSIAELAGPPDEEAEETGRTQALVFANGYLWAAGGYGLARLRG